MRIVFLALLFFPVLLEAQIQSDCSPAEKKALLHAEFVSQYVLNGSVSAHDCTTVKLGDKEVLLINVVANTKSGLESYLAVYDRTGFSEKSGPIFKSPALGFDTFPVLVKNVQRLVFVHPSTDKARLVLYMTLQTGPAATRLSRWELAMDKKDLAETTRTWSFEAGILAKIYQDKDTWRALIDVRSVEL